MKKRIGTKLYDTDKAVLVDTLPDGIQVYRKNGGSREVFLYNPSGKNKHEMFFDLPADQAVKYLPVRDSKRIEYSNTIRFTPYDIDRIRTYAFSANMSMSKFLLSLVDEYERNHQ